MAIDILSHVVNGYNYLMDEQGDKRVKDWFLMSGPFPTLFICISYVIICRHIGPKFMENRKPYKLKNILIFYNAFQTLFSAWIFYEYWFSGWGVHYSYRCQPVDYSTSPIAMRMARTCWWYYFSKFTEFFDTFFFILRKKYSQVSTLHIIHHGIMPMSVWFGMKFAPGGHSTFFALLNTFVHIVMYFYYMMSALGPKYRRFLWWKKYLTVFQMFQFVLIFTHQFQLLFYNDCNYPKSFVFWIAMHGVLFLYLFSRFYNQQYIVAKAEADARAAANTTSNETNNITETSSEGNNQELPNGNAIGAGTTTYTETATDNACNDVYYSNGINNGFMETTGSSSEKDKKLK